MTGLIERHDRSFCEIYGFCARWRSQRAERKRRARRIRTVCPDAGHALSDGALCRHAGQARRCPGRPGRPHEEQPLTGPRPSVPRRSRSATSAIPAARVPLHRDYIIADSFVIPADAAQHYTEQVVYLPDCFQANDDKRPDCAVCAARAQVRLARARLRILRLSQRLQDQSWRSSTSGCACWRQYRAV